MNNSYIAHHGVKGQQWGVRNGPPYPLNASAHSSSEKKAGWRKSLGKSDNLAKISQKQSSASSFVSKYGRKSVPGLAGDVGEEYMYYAISWMASVAVFAIGIHISVRSAHKRKMKELEDLYQQRKIKKLSEAPKLEEKMPASESMKLVNPDYPSDGTTMNCTSCTTALVMREKGYNVKSIKLQDGMFTDDLFKKTFNATEIKMPKKQTVNSFTQELKKNGEGSYGNLTVDWILGGSHSIFWKVENGKVRIYDGQNGTEYTESSSTQNQFFGSINGNTVRYTRLDNCTPTEYALAMVEPIRAKQEDNK